MKKLLITVAFVGLALAALYPNRGMFPPFYYQEFNAVQNRLDDIDGLRIRDSWQHKDIRLERTLAQSLNFVRIKQTSSLCQMRNTIIWIT